MTIAFVLGNGTSRRDIDLKQLQTHGAVYGCNALYRDFEPTVLVSTDPPISAEIQNSGYSQQHCHYTRKPLPESGAQRIPSRYFGFSSGPAAVGIATQDRHRKIYLLGFDLGPLRSGVFNNVYAGTAFYKKTHAAPTYTGNWVRQLVSIMTDNPRAEFWRVHGETTADIADFATVANCHKLGLNDFLDRINTGKDL
jgi:hypothetical protein